MDYVKPNKTSGKPNDRYYTNYPQDFEKSYSAIDKTPYMTYQNKILGRNKKITQENISHLKQD